MKERDFNLDVLRVMACLMVVFMHSPRPETGLTGIICAGDSLFTEPCIGLFFMISGALLLPVKQPFFQFLKRRLSKIIGPTLFFTAFFVIVKLNRGRIGLEDVPRMILSIPFSPQAHPIVWFMYALTGMYLIAPIITPFLEKANKRELQFVLFSWIVTLAWPLLRLFVDVDNTDGSMLHVFSGYTGYFVLGYYFKKYPFKLSMMVNILILIVPYFVYFFVKMYNFNVDFYILFWYLTIPGALMCIAWWQIIHQIFSNIQISSSVKIFFAHLSNLSFGIYLIHAYILWYCIWPSNLFMGINPILYLAITYALTMFISWFISYIISFLPFGKYIIGFQQKCSRSGK